MTRKKEPPLYFRYFSNTNKPKKKSLSKLSRSDIRDWDGAWSQRRAFVARRKPKNRRHDPAVEQLAESG